MAFVCDGLKGLTLVNISNLKVPVAVKSIPITGFPTKLRIFYYSNYTFAFMTQRDKG